MNDEYNLANLHDNLLLIIREIDILCKSHNLTYFLTDGSALGAVRHKGFIPWDDDLDIAMPRCDYEKFCALCKKELPKFFFYQNIDTDSYYKFTYAKIRLNNTLFQEKRFINSKLHQGIYVDVFPLDDVPKSKLFSKIQKYNFILYRNLLEDLMPKNKIKYILFYIFKLPLKIKPIKRIFLKGLKRLTEYSFKNKSDYVTYFCGRFDYKNTTFKKKYIENLEILEFNDIKLPVPYKYDEYLRNVFGDYMKIPSNEQINKDRHSTFYISLKEEDREKLVLYLNQNERNFNEIFIK